MSEMRTGQQAVCAGGLYKTCVNYFNPAKSLY